MPMVNSRPAGTPSWYDLATGKLDEAKGFYNRLFGWTFEDQGPEFGHYHMVYRNGHAVAGMGGKSPEMAAMPSAWTVYYSSDSAAKDAQRIKDLGGQVMVEPMQIGAMGHMLIATDPTGAAFGLWQPIEFQGSALEAEHGSMAWQEVNTRDSGRALEFYTHLFSGTSEAITVETMPGATVYYVMKKGEKDIGGILQMDHQWGDMPPHWMAYFAVNDIQEATRIASEHGGKVGVQPFDTPYGTIAVLMDPDGAAFSVVQLKS